MIISSYPQKCRITTKANLERKFEIIDWKDKNISQPKSNKIFPDVSILREHLTEKAKISGQEVKVVAISGGFDPIHIGHIQYIQSAAKLVDGGVLVVIANKDSWLQRKKGFAFMPEEERMEILSSIRGVDFVIPWDDGTPSVAGCLEILKPHIFANGGDRDSIENVPEYSVCKEIECKMAFGVGGGKIQSSSDLVRSYKNAAENLRK